MTRFNLSFDPPVLNDPANDPARLAATGKAVREKLLAHDSARDLGGEALDLFVIPDFLDHAECDRIVKVIDSKIGPSALFKGTEVDGFRTSSTHHFDERDRDTISLQRKIADTLGIDVANGEVMQGQRYEPNQQYKHHFDYFTPSQPYWQQERRRGGQRTWTAMVFLNEPEAGGETDFASLKLKIPPRTGAVVIWNNMDRNGHPNSDTLHAGLPVLKGCKYVITQWFRQDYFTLALR